MEFRTAVLTIDRSTVLPLMYEYDEHNSCFRSVGFVRVGQMMIPEIQHAGPDTTSTRDQFLMKVLAGVLISDRRARKIVREAQHDPHRPTPAG